MQLIDAIKRVNRINGIKRAPIIFDVLEGIIVISSGLDNRIADTSIDILNPCHVDSLNPTAVVSSNAEITFHLNVEYILICLNSIISDEVTFRVRDSESGIYISGGCDEQTVIMPVKMR
jgi:DNA polymerase III sliding clamp (beta) subunit (PCNA family)